MTINAEFPVGRPVTEAQMIGRGPCVFDLEMRLRDCNKLNLLAGRRTGKSSVALAVVGRIGATPGLGTHIQLNEVTHTTGEVRRLRAAVNESLASIPSQAWKESWPTASEPPAEVPEEIERGGFTAVLEYIAGAMPTGSATFCLDEAHYVAGWPPHERNKLRSFLQRDEQLGVVLASSEASAFSHIIGPGQTFHQVGQRYPLPPISAEDWEFGLRSRFDRAGTPITPTALDLLLELSRLHPGCTMLLARQSAYDASSLLGRVTDAIVQVALLTVEVDPMWELRHDAD